MKPLPRNLLFLALLCGGLLAGRAIPSAGEPHVSDGSTALEQPAARKDRPARTETGRTFATLAARVKAEETAPGTLAAALARVKTETLKSIVLEQYGVLAAMTEGGKTRQPHQDLYSAAIEELWARGQFSALEWAATLENPKERAMMQKSLLRRALEEDVAGALPWVERYQAENGKAGNDDEFRNIAIRGAVAHGVDAVIRAHGSFEGPGGYHAFQNVVFPEGFDFEKLHRELGGKMEMTQVFTQWTLRDRDAAWAAMEKRLQGNQGAHAAEIGEGMMKAVLVKEGETAGVAWMMDRLSSLPDRDGRFHQLILGGIIANSNLSTEGIAVISAKLTPEGRMMNAKSALIGLPDHASTGAFLATLPREELILTLREVRRMTAGSNATEAARRGRGYTEMQRRFHLTPGEMADIEGDTANR